jgi:type I restriction-modification system DNA methylase subunit
MADLTFLFVAHCIKLATDLLYNVAYGTWDILSLVEERLAELVRKHEKNVSINFYGQDINPETFAITKADLLIKGERDIFFLNLRFPLSHLYMAMDGRAVVVKIFYSRSVLKFQVISFTI